MGLGVSYHLPQELVETLVMFWKYQAWAREGCVMQSNNKAGAGCPEIKALVMLPPRANMATWQVKLPVTQAVGFAETHPVASWACFEVQVALGPSAGRWSIKCHPQRLHPHPLKCVESFCPSLE